MFKNVQEKNQKTSQTSNAYLSLRVYVKCLDTHANREV